MLFDRTWRVEDLGDVVLLCVGQGDTYVRHDDAAWSMLRWRLLQRDPRVLSALLDVRATIESAPLASPQTYDQLEHLARELDRAVSLGLLRVARGPLRTGGAPPPLEDEERPERHDTEPVPPPPPDEGVHNFVVRVLDMRGYPVDGVQMMFDVHGRREMVATNGDGIAELFGMEPATSSVRFADTNALRDILYPRWEERLDHLEIDDPSPVRMIIADSMGSVSLAHEVQRTIVVRPRVLRIRLIGMFFDMNKAFLLPSAMRGIRRVREIYEQLPNARLLIVGHTDTSVGAGGTEFNDNLSIDRARAVEQFLKDDVAGWQSRYGEHMQWDMKWGLAEDRHMLGALPTSETPYLQNTSHASYRAFQEAKGLPATGTGDAATRAALIADYMAHDGTSIPTSVTTVVHGCGQNFVDVEPGEDERNRRVEIFVFDGPIIPAPSGELSGPGSLDYPAWRLLVEKTVDFTADAPESDAIRIRLYDHEGEPMRDVPYKLDLGGEIHEGVSADGILSVNLLFCPETATLEWGPMEDIDRPYAYRRELHLDCQSHVDPQQQARNMLHNLGYHLEDMDRTIRLFQLEHEMDITGPDPGGIIPELVREKIVAVYDQHTPGGA
jgi:outer membrane protein OmpA-like peptidoglycan-associated protein